MMEQSLSQTAKVIKLRHSRKSTYASQSTEGEAVCLSFLASLIDHLSAQGLFAFFTFPSWNHRWASSATCIYEGSRDPSFSSHTRATNALTTELSPPAPQFGPCDSKIGQR